MTKFGKVVFVTLAALLVGGAIPTSASAAKWHKGSPKALRGNFQAKRTSSAEGFGAAFTLTKSRFEMGVSNMPVQIMSHLKYKKVGKHLYRLKGHIAKNGFVLARNADFAVYRKGKTFACTDYGYHKKHGFAKVNYAKQVKHFKNGGPILKSY
ncbi:hypothetical protein IV54_GL001637 [Levilactobacillus paucivorans]|uniref:Uncharacterized protein n=1 Tax=Levilactobacillus paucivorans TaxID=616990 RepID=A0A0R2LS78_9LACO|nr:hypothetical protein [Levilactobacillus paucivorans]KRO04118.1 hypothetical protein IV54_GL001637 [Levilactobacillus paucivorans]